MFKKKPRQTALFKVEKDAAHLIGGPQKSSKTFPNWLKKLPKYLPLEDVPKESVTTVKGCVPFIEAMSQGATFSLWCDLRVVVREHFIPTDENGEDFTPHFTILDYPSGNLPKDKTELHGKVIKDEHGKDRTISHLRSGGLGSAFMFPEGYWQNFISKHAEYQVKGLKGRYGHPPQVFKLNSPWVISTPKGYSTYFKNPCNKFDSPLTIFEGFVDTDYYNNTAINFPLFLEWHRGRDIYSRTRNPHLSNVVYQKGCTT